MRIGRANRGVGVAERIHEHDAGEVIGVAQRERECGDRAPRVRDEQRLLGAELAQREADESRLCIERGVVPRALAAAAAGAIDEQRAKVVGDAREERRHEVRGVAIVALQEDDRTSFAAINDVECGVLDVDAAAVDVDGCVACRGASEKRDHGRAAGQDDHQTQYPSRHRLPPRKR